MAAQPVGIDAQPFPNAVAIAVGTVKQYFNHVVNLSFVTVNGNTLFVAVNQNNDVGFSPFTPVVPFAGVFVFVTKGGINGPGFDDLAVRYDGGQQQAQQ